MSRVRLAPFLVKCLAFMAALSVPWFWAAAGYTEALAASVRVLLPEPLDMQASGHALKLLVSSSSGMPPIAPVSIQTLGFGYGIVLTGALMLSTPGLRLGSRLYGIGIAWVVLFIAQVAVTYAFGRIAYSSLLGGASRELVVASLWLMYGVWIVLPPLLWIAWSLRYWLLAKAG